MMIPDWERTLTDKPVCPHCGNKISCAWELDLGDEDTNEVDCGECSKPFRVMCRVFVKYSTDAEIDTPRDSQGQPFEYDTEPLPLLNPELAS